MKRFIPCAICVWIVALTSLNAIELTVMGGGNYQRIKYLITPMVVGYDDTGEGFGLHGGAFIELGITPKIVLECGCLMHQFRVIQYHRYFLNQGVRTCRTNLIFPAFIKGRIFTVNNVDGHLGIGFYANSVLSNRTTFFSVGNLSETHFFDSFGLQAKFDMSVRLTPRLRLKPSLTAHFKGSDYNSTRVSAIFGSLGLSYGF